MCFGRAAHAAPPEDGALLNDVIQPGFADLARAQLRVVIVILQSAEEDETAGNVVIGDDERHADFVVDVIADLAETLADVLVAPAFHGAPQVDADQLAEDAG